MIKIFIGGITVGLANIIPGVSGGTMMVVLGLFNRVMESISGLFSIKNENRKDDFIFLCILGIGAVVGLVVFAKVLDVLFNTMPTQTMFAFVGMVMFSIPALLKKEINIEKVNIIYLIIGIMFIIILQLFSPETNEYVVTLFPTISFTYIGIMFLAGMVSGGAMFIPGVSGSMLLIITGQYYLFKSLLSNVTSFQLNILVPLFTMGIGIILGIIISSKITKYCLQNHHRNTMSFLLGLVIASSIVLIPVHVSYTLPLTITCLIAFTIGGLLVVLLEKIA